MNLAALFGSSTFACLLLVGSTSPLPAAKPEPAPAPEQGLSPLQKTDASVQALLAKFRYREALPAALEALHLYESLQSQDPDELASRLSLVADLYKATGHFTDAELHSQRALAVCEKQHGPEHALSLAKQKKLAALHAWFGRFDTARSRYEKTLASARTALGERDPIVHAILHDLAGIEASQGANEKAETLYLESLALKKNTLPEEHPDTAATQSELADLYIAVGNYEKAQPLCQASLEARSHSLGPRHPETAKSLSAMGRLLLAMGNLEEAETSFLRALEIRMEIFGELHPETASSLSALAQLAFTRQRYANAETFYLRAIDIKEKTLGADHPETAKMLANLASVYEAQKKLQKAEVVYRWALEIQEKTQEKNPAERASVMNNLAVVYQKLQRLDEAQSLHLGALEIQKKTLPQSHPDLIASLRNLAFVQIGKANPNTARTLAQEAGDAQERLLAQVLSFTSEEQRALFQKSQHPYTLPGTLGDATLMASTLLHWKGVVLDSILEDLALAQSANQSGLGHELQKKAVLQAELRRLTLSLPPNQTEAALLEREALRAALQSQIQSIEASLARTTSKTHSHRRSVACTPAEISAKLQTGEVLVEYIRYLHHLGPEHAEMHYGAIVFSQNSPPRWFDLGPADSIEKWIRLYQKSARGKTDETTLKSSLRSLYDALWNPIERGLPSTPERVILSPDAQLHFISFASLLSNRDQFLCEALTLRYVSSARDLLASNAPPAGQSVVALYGNPLYRTSTPTNPPPPNRKVSTSSKGKQFDFETIKLKPLIGSETECTLLQNSAAKKRFQTVFKTQSAASESSIQALHSPTILHIATHGFFLPEVELSLEGTSKSWNSPVAKGALLNPMHRSGLALSGAQSTLDSWSQGDIPNPENDGILSAEEAGTLPLSGTWLVTLSACDTGAGEARSGEGVLGLRRGFMLAGAQNLLFTLWPISDKTTVEIMRDFYEQCFAGTPAPDALASVQRNWLLKLRKQNGLQTAVNLAAPFILSSQGIPAPVTLPK
ncbi:MAG: hypothetical protein RLZZ244_963 [Verrucomicrobiota bacterium]